MIKGNPLKLMLQFAFPLLLGNLLQQTYNIIDAAIVGQILGAKALASVGASSSIQFLVLGFCMGSCTGFGVPVAKYFGAEKIEKCGIISLMELCYVQELQRSLQYYAAFYVLRYYIFYQYRRTFMTMHIVIC